MKINKFLLGVIAVSFCLTGCQTEKTITRNDRIAFSLPNSHNQYYVFNVEGKKLNKEGFDNDIKFKNGYGIIEKSNKQGIINVDGDITVKVGKYRDLKSVGYLFSGINKKGHRELINGNGDKISDLKHDKLHSVEGVDVIVLETKDKYEILDAAGKSLVDFDKVKNQKLRLNADSINNLLVVQYNDKEYLIDGNKNELIVDFESNKLFKIIGIDKNKILLGYIPKDAKMKGADFKLINDGKIAFESNNKYSSMYLKDGQIIAEKKQILTNDLLDDKGKAVLAITHRNCINDHTYVEQNKNDLDKLDFYKDNKKIRTVDGLTINEYDPIAKEGCYLLKTIDSAKLGIEGDQYYFYNADGKKINKKPFIQAQPFNDTKLAIVSTDGKQSYLIDKRGKKVSKLYDNITYIGDKMYSAKEGNQLTVLDDRGNKIIDGEYDQAIVAAVDGNSYLLLQNNELARVYSCKEKKIILKNEGMVYIRNGYIEINKDNTIMYFTLKGERINN